MKGFGMKKLICLGLVLSLAMGNFCFASDPKAAATNAGSTKFDVGQLSLAALGLAGSIGTSIPKLIPQIKEFPDRAMPQLRQLLEGIKWAGSLPQITDEQKKTREIAIQELFLLAVNLLVDVNNIVDNVFVIVKQFGPLISAVDKGAGDKVGEAVKIMADVLYSVSIVSKGMTKYVRADLRNEGKEAYVNKTPEAGVIEKPLPEL
jgi:hypothetical protein